MISAVCSGVRPVEFVEDPIRFLGADRQAAGTGPKRSLPAFAALPDKPVRKLKVRQVLLAGDGILERFAAPLGDSTQIRSGLATGDVIVTKGSFAVRSEAERLAR